MGQSSLSPQSTTSLLHRLTKIGARRRGNVVIAGPRVDRRVKVGIGAKVETVIAPVVVLAPMMTIDVDRLHVTKQATEAQIGPIQMDGVRVTAVPMDAAPGNADQTLGDVVTVAPKVAGLIIVVPAGLVTGNSDPRMTESTEIAICMVTVVTVENIAKVESIAGRVDLSLVIAGPTIAKASSLIVAPAGQDSIIETEMTADLGITSSVVEAVKDADQAEATLVTVV